MDSQGTKSPGASQLTGQDRRKLINNYNEENKIEMFRPHAKSSKIRTPADHPERRKAQTGKEEWTAGRAYLTEHGQDSILDSSSTQR